jgi:hypothetical protein
MYVILKPFEERRSPDRAAAYNLHSAASITGNLAQGVSSGEAIGNIEATADRTRQPGMGTEWTELMFLQIRAGNTALFVFPLAVLCVFLALAALHESWTMPLAVILVVPMCLLCALAGVWITHDSVNSWAIYWPSPVPWIKFAIALDDKQTASSIQPAPSPSGKAADCKSAIPGSIPGGASRFTSADFSPAARRNRGSGCPARIARP